MLTIPHFHRYCEGRPSKDQQEKSMKDLTWTIGRSQIQRKSYVRFFPVNGDALKIKSIRWF